MLIFALGTVAILFALWWAFLHETKTVFPQSLTETVESESFRKWLGEDSQWLLWGRDEEGRYYAITLGSLAARQIRKKAYELHASRSARPGEKMDAGSSPA